VHDLLGKIDHAVLHPTQQAGDVRAACELAARLRIASVCVKPSYVSLAADLLQGSTVAAGTVVGFPHGGTSTVAKMAEAIEACQAGAAEIDMVVNLGKVLAAEWDYTLSEITQVVQAARDGGALTKVILEMGLLPDRAIKVRLCKISEEAGAAFIKTSTGFGFVKNATGQLVPTGATEEDVSLMVASVSPRVGVKASGGIRSFREAARMMELGAARIGTSATEAIAKGIVAAGDY
jgi:deoxyribose-phosphate aldolase